MTEPAPPGLWAVLPNPLRVAFIVALITSLSAGGLLLSNEIRSELAPGFSRGGDFAGPAGGSPPPAVTSTPGLVAGGPRSSAVLSAPDGDDDPLNATVARSGFPHLGRYIYDVDGYEEATAFGRRDLPDEMAMTVHRGEASSGDAPALEHEELIFDLYFSDDHSEREIVAYGRDGISFTYEASQVTFGPGFAPRSEASYHPPMLQIPAKLESGATISGTSTARSADGTVTRIEDWAVTVEGPDRLLVAGAEIAAWVVSVERQSRPESPEQFHRMRRYWFDPAQAIWVKWEESTSGSDEFGPGALGYSAQFTATLDRVEPAPDAG